MEWETQHTEVEREKSRARIFISIIIMVPCDSHRSELNLHRFEDKYRTLKFSRRLPRDADLFKTAHHDHI